MRVVAILQARTGSTRLPNKVLLPLAGKSMLQNIVERVRRSTRLDDIVVAIPSSDHGKIGNYRMYEHHDESDLVGRYLAAARAYNADVIVRIPCDNPCIDPVYIDAAIEAYEQYPFIYYSNTTAKVGVDVVDGVGVEVFSRSRLEWLHRRTKGNPVWREHPHKYFEECGLLELPRATVRLDVNTEEDYRFLSAIYDHFGHNRFTTEEVLGFLTTQGGCYA